MASTLSDFKISKKNVKTIRELKRFELESDQTLTFKLRLGQKLFRPMLTCLLRLRFDIRLATPSGTHEIKMRPVVDFHLFYGLAGGATAKYRKCSATQHVEQAPVSSVFTFPLLIYCNRMSRQMPRFVPFHCSQLSRCPKRRPGIVLAPF